jgi:hypothetical protein
MSASPQIFQGVGSTVGSTFCAPTRAKDAGNSNLGTFGVCAHFIIAFLLSALLGLLNSVTQFMCLTVRCRSSLA